MVIYTTKLFKIQDVGADKIRGQMNGFKPDSFSYNSGQPNRLRLGNPTIRQSDNGPDSMTPCLIDAVDPVAPIGMSGESFME